MTLIILTELNNFNLAVSLMKRSEKSSLVLLSDATYIIARQDEFTVIEDIPSLENVYVLNEDAKKRGLENSSKNVSLVNYRKLVTVIMGHQNIINL